MTIKYKKYILAVIFVAITAFTGTSSVPTAHAFSDNASWARNQQQIMTQAQRQMMIQMLLQLQARINQLLAQLELDDDSDRDSELSVVTLAATNIDSDEALLRGRVLDFNRSDYADVWFEYDTDRNDLDNKTSTRRIDDDEYRAFGYRVTNLRDDTTYYYRAAGADDEGERDYGSVFSFTTNRDNNGSDEPSVTTQSATNVRDDSVELRGYVDMNDFNNGEVFFVYGEDENQVQDVEDDFDSYLDVDEDGDDLQKVRVDRDLDDQASYQTEVSFLNDNTRHYFTICVGYEDEDDDQVLKCGSVRSFTTD